MSWSSMVTMACWPRLAYWMAKCWTTADLNVSEPIWRVSGGSWFRSKRATGRRTREGSVVVGAEGLAGREERFDPAARIGSRYEVEALVGVVVEQAQDEASLVGDEVVDRVVARAVAQDVEGHAAAGHLQRGEDREVVVAQELDGAAGALLHSGEEALRDGSQVLHRISVRGWLGRVPTAGRQSEPGAMRGVRTQPRVAGTIPRAGVLRRGCRQAAWAGPGWGPSGQRMRPPSFTLTSTLVSTDPRPPKTDDALRPARLQPLRSTGQAPHAVRVVGAWMA